MRTLWASIFLLLALPGLGFAQTAAAEEALWQAEFEDDPIGLDDSTLPATGAVPTPPTTTVDAEYGPRPRHGRAVHGEVLTAMASVRETSHKTQVTLGDGVAQVEVRLQLENHSDEPAEALYRLAVPPGAIATFLRVCHDEAHCREGVAQAAAQSPSAYDAALLARGPSQDALLPIGEVRPAGDPRGWALQLRVAPVRKTTPITATLRYLVKLPLVGGVSRLHLPPRGMDPRVSPDELSVSGPLYADRSAGGRPVLPGELLSLAPWTGVDLAGRLRPDLPPTLEVLSYPCGLARCVGARARATGQASQPSPVDLIVAVDVSPSTIGAARNRMGAALSALLETAPAGSQVRALMFASRARALVTVPTAPNDLPLSTLKDALSAPDLGSATRLEAALAVIKPWPLARGRRAVLAVLGDGGLTTGGSDVIALAKRRGLSVALINLDDDPVPASVAGAVRQRGGMVVEAGQAGEAYERTRAPDVLSERMRTLFARTLAEHVTCRAGNKIHHLGPLRAGDEVELELVTPKAHPRMICQGQHLGTSAAGPVRGSRDAPLKAAFAESQRLGQTPVWVAVARNDLGKTMSDFPEAPALLPHKKSQASRCDRRGPARRQSGVNRDDSPIILAHDRACAVKTASEPSEDESLGKGMPADPLLDMLRKRIIPVARDCFRRDRAGRADYAVRAVFRFELANQEVVDSRVDGAIPAELRSCLQTAVDALHVPRFTGVVRVRYPLHTLREALPERVQLSRTTAEDVDRLIALP